MGTELNAKPHYLILDGLRGIAAILVVFFHLFEAHSSGHLDQVINHGYLAVDFFFVLSGFVVGYAYDDRWNKMTIGAFFKRRLIRLQPMVVMGMFIGAVFFFFGSDCFGRFFVFKRHNIVFVVFFGHFSDRVFFLFTHKNTPFDYFEQPDGVLYFLKREKLI